MDLDFHAKFKDIHAKWLEIGFAHAEERGKYYQMEKSEKILLAKLTRGFLADGMTLGKAGIEARASDDYQKLVNEIAEQGVLVDKLHVKKEGEWMRFESHRSLSSLEKATRNLTG